MGQNAHSIELLARGVLRRGDRVLLCRSVRHNYYYLPGGHVEFGECAPKALSREFLEETGLSFSIGPLLATMECRFVQSGRERHELSLLFLVEHEWGRIPTLPDVNSLESKIAFDWVAVSRLHSIDLRPQPVADWLLDSDPQPWISIDQRL